MKIGILLFFTLCCINSFAQFYSIDKAILSEIENYDVIFELLPESENDLSEIPKKKKKKKDENIEEYPEFNKTLNDAAKRTLAKYWKLTSGTIEFKTQKEISALTFSDLKNKITINCGWLAIDSKYQGMLILYAFQIKYINSKNTEELIFEFAYQPYVDVRDADFIFFAKSLTQIKDVSLKYEVYKQSHVFADNMKIVESKTLLADSALLDKKATIDAIKKTYPFKFEIAGRDIIEKSIIEECDTCLFFKPIYSRKNGSLMFDVFDTKDMKIIAAAGTGGVTIKLQSESSTTWTRKFNAGSGGSGYYSYEPTTSPTPGRGTGGKTLWKSPLTIGAGHFKLILNEGAQKMNFK